MKQQIYAKNLEKGHPIVVTYNSRLVFGIFWGYGKTGNLRYIHPYTEGFKFFKERVESGKNPYVSHINRNYENTIAKVSLEDINDEKKYNYTQYMEVLTKNKLL